MVCFFFIVGFKVGDGVFVLEYLMNIMVINFWGRWLENKWNFDFVFFIFWVYWVCEDVFFDECVGFIDDVMYDGVSFCWSVVIWVGVG